DLSVRPWRKKEYFEQCIVSREYYKETRLFGAVEFFKSKYLDSLEELKLIKYEACKKNGLIDLGLSITMVVSYIGIIIVLMDSLLKNFVTVGAFAAVYAALDEFFLQMDCILQYDFGNVTSEFGKIKNYFEFMEMVKEESRLKKGKGQIEEFLYARMDNLSFAYPKGEAVLKNINFLINKGETIAVVGENGSGKSTFSKVLFGLYQPQKGKYIINGRDSSEIDTDAIFSNVSVVFQNFMKYQMSLRENIIFSEIEDDEVDRKLEYILAQVGLKEKADELGLGAVLSREFGNKDISGGEWQRLAIARAIYKAHDVLILDEPTSAIDPNDETKLYELFYELSRDKTSIIITHRIGAAAKADRIIVFRDGEIVQEGTYHDLLCKDGEFKRLYEAQAKWYDQETMI
ncbi:MAG: ABC transporter ATP-binding protein/permease, partial [Lachnospiraceae bacterium]|nr:ABC transporter ATP-binding protein/permease [Lachnospiraceae bacterium]